MGGGGDVWMVVWVGESGVMGAKPFWVEWGYTAMHQTSTHLFEDISHKHSRLFICLKLLRL